MNQVSEEIRHFFNAINFYIQEWKGGDDPVHVLGHIKKVLDDFPMQEMAQTQESSDPDLSELDSAFPAEEETQPRKPNKLVGCVSYVSSSCIYLRDGSKVSIRRDGTSARLVHEQQAVISIQGDTAIESEGEMGTLEQMQSRAREWLAGQAVGGDMFQLCHYVLALNGPEKEVEKPREDIRKAITIPWKPGLDAAKEAILGANGCGYIEGDRMCLLEKNHVTPHFEPDPYEYVQISTRRYDGLQFHVRSLEETRDTLRLALLKANEMVCRHTMPFGWTDFQKENMLPSALEVLAQAPVQT